MAKVVAARLPVVLASRGKDHMRLRAYDLPCTLEKRRGPGSICVISLSP